jgi:nitrogen regulatory protein PII
MPKYSVTLCDTRTRFVVIEVDSEDEEKAEEVAEFAAYEEDLDWDIGDGSISVTNIEEIK